MQKKCWLNFALVAFIALAGLTGCELWDGDDDDGSSAEPGLTGSGFLWKPKSEGDGNLVVLLPNFYKGNVDNCYIEDANGTILETGRFAGDDHNGERVHFRFAEHGGFYGENLRVIADLSDGTSIYWSIPNGSNRTEL